MVDNIQLFKEQMINNYLSSIDLNEININKIKKDLKEIIGEEPAIKINYKKEEVINEDKKTQIEKIESITIIFTVDKEITPGNDAIIPISRTYIID